MKQFEYSGVDGTGRKVRGSTGGASREEVLAQLKSFGFSAVRIREWKAPEPGTEETSQGDSAQRLVDGDTEAGEAAEEEEEEGIDEWRRLEAMERTRLYRHKENITIAVILIVLGIISAYFIFDQATEIRAPQPKIIMNTSSEMLSFNDVYIGGDNLIFVIYAKNWNGNVRVDFKAWDPFGHVVGFGTARLGFIGSHFGGSPEKSGTFKLKKTRFYETIEIRVSGDEGK